MDHQELLEELVASLDNLPSEVRHIFNELRARSEEFYELRTLIAQKDQELKKMIRASPVDPPSESQPQQHPQTQPGNDSSTNPAAASSSADNSAQPPTLAPQPADSAPGAAPSATQPKLQASDLGLSWKSGAESVELYPDQKDAFWKIVQMFGDCNRISDEKIALVERAKLAVDRHIKRIATSLEVHGILQPAPQQSQQSANLPMATPGAAAPSLLGPATTPAPGGFPLSGASSAGNNSSQILRVASQASLFATPLNSQTSKFLSQRSVSSSTDILHKASQLAAAVVAESKAAAAAAAAQKHEHQKRPPSLSFGGNNQILPSASNPNLPSTTPAVSAATLSGTPHAHQTQHNIAQGATAAAGVGGALTAMGLNKKRLKRKIFEESLSSKAASSALSQSASGGTPSAAEGDEENCEKEWFHLECVGLKAPPEGVWLCPECAAKKAAGGSIVVDDDDLDADDGSADKKSVFASAATPAQKKKRVR
ncbi:Histone acetyltransferase complex subunit [Entophlyctis luteolus]|nr:Histone acetyltransferase complex subunit [Entophlyctis luteolus]